MKRKFEIGKNQTEAAVEGASWLVGAGEVKAMAGIGKLSKAARVQRHVDQGFTEAQATYLAEPYRGKAHHSIIPQRARLPEFMGGGPVPPWILESSFNKLQPRGISRGEFYELHSQVDPYYYGSRLPKAEGGGRWSSKQLGLEKYDPLRQLYYGTPGDTKAAVSGAAATGDWYADGRSQEDERR